MNTPEQLQALVRDIHRLAQRSAVLAGEAAALTEEAEHLLAVAAQRKAAVLDEAPPGKPHSRSAGRPPHRRSH
jgi:hypothetical protein